MNKPLSSAILAGLLMAAGSVAVPSAQAAEATLECHLDFNLTGWSLIYKHAEGTGTVSCANGQSIPVKLSVKGGGLTAGKWHIDDGKGKFTDVHKMDDVLGRYAQGEAHAGLIKSSTAQVLSKGTVSLALAGTGEGVNLGIDVGAFTISRIGDTK